MSASDAAPPDARSNPQSASLRDDLAIDRTLLAAERTYSAWNRTGLAALAGAMATRSLFRGALGHGWGLTAALLLVAFAEFCFFIAVWREATARVPRHRADVRGEIAAVPPWVWLTVNVLLAALGLVVLGGMVA